MQRWYDFIADYNGKPLAGATVHLLNYPALTTATYFTTTDTSSPQIIPMTSGEDGSIAFYAADGHYQLSITGRNGRVTTIPDILIEDPAEGSVALASVASTATYAISAGTSSYSGTSGYASSAASANTAGTSSYAGTSGYAGTAGFLSSTGAVALASTATWAISAGTATANAPISGNASQPFAVGISTSSEQAIRLDQAGMRLVQIVTTQVGAFSTGTNIIPYDDTIPQISEGDQYMSKVIITTNSTSILEVTAQGLYGRSLDGNVVQMAIFSNSTDAIAVTACRVNSTGAVEPLYISCFTTLNGTATSTFSVRAGGASTGVTTFNGIPSGGAKYGGVSASGITIKEYLP